MALKYRYKAISRESGKIVRGTLQAENPTNLEFTLRENNLELINFTEVKESKLASFLAGKITTKDIISIFVHLEQLDKAGVTILDSLSDLREGTDSPKIRDLAQDMHEAVKGGKMLSEAMADHKKVFAPVIVNLVKASEKTGSLHEAFGNILHNIRWSAEIKRKTVKAIRYPLFSLLVMFGTMAMMLKVVVPKVTKFVIDQGIELPIYTRALMGFSSFFQNYMWLMILLPILLVVGLKLARLNDFTAVKVDDIKTRLPVFGKLIVKLEASRFCHFFATSFKGGIPVLECLKITEDVIQNKAIKESVAMVGEKVSEGNSLASSIALTGYFPNLVVRMFKVGEESGNMVDALQNIEYFYNKEVNDSIDKMIGVIQPSLTFVMGGLMGWIVVAVFGPLYGSFGNF